ncbi:hypothetical protein SD37_06895 [Amycolatopsis orientalis]|uniref:Glyoxalase/fosfomycin resistance/dioxygenase domain-containing protein n=1 Tax=Amycolatopsis orientalis TaxID=31958 RepID=A0A193BT99_AMYOR|nr:hypothetical protein [Amycolatopsis orientalis]ANN15408.1 hypothetical protein SD37_06895 [Amycolatopsis orientalis]
MNRALGLVPHLFVKDVDVSLSFYSKAFGAVELFRNVLPNGVVLFVELAIGDARLISSGARCFAGARVEAPVEEMFFHWALTTKREQYTPEDIDARTPPEV